MTTGDQIRTLDICGYSVTVNDQLGHMEVAHDGSMSWDRLQEIKTIVWGADARAIEVYPRASDVVNSGNFRHLWRLGEGDFCPDLLGFETEGDTGASDFLWVRCRRAWAEAEGVFA